VLRLLVGGAKVYRMNADGDGDENEKKRKWGRICQNLLPRSLYCALYCFGSCSKMSDGEGGGWSNGYWCCWVDGRRTEHHGSAVVHHPKGGQREARCRPLRRTTSSRLAGRRTWRWTRTCRGRGRKAPVWILLAWEGDLGTVEPMILWRGKGRSHRGPDMRRSSIYGCGRT
jgi:hypothetical protein